MTDSCLSADRLFRYVSSDADPGDAERLLVEEHAAGCGSCRLTLVALGLADQPGTAEEEARLGSLIRSRPVDVLLADLGLEEIPATPRKPAATVLPFAARPRRGAPVHRAVSRWVAGAAAIAAAVALAVFLLPASGPEAYELPIASRASEGRPSQGVAWAPFAPVRGGAGGPGNAIDAEGRIASLGKKDRGAADSLLTALYLWRGADGDQARARALLDTRPPTAARENDRGVLLLSTQQANEALASFDKALKSDPNLLAAWFNRAIALEVLGRKDEAATAWEAYLARSAKEPDDAWVGEARSRLDALRRRQ